VQFFIRINSLKLENSNKMTNLSSTLQAVLGKIIRHLKIVISFYLSLLENAFCFRIYDRIRNKTSIR